MDTKRGALAAAILGSTVVAVDATAVNVALPAIADDLGGGLAGQQWVANAYLLTLSSLILISGSLADLYGERRVFSAGVAGFGVASLLCAIAPTVELLVLARALQGVFGALLTPASLAIIVAVFPESERGAAIGSWTAWGGIGYMLGPLIGGQLVDSASWRWVFFLNLPIVLVTLWLARAYVPQARDLGGTRPRLDVAGALLCAAALAGISFGLIEQPLRGWGDPGVALPLVGGTLLFVAFIAWERRAPAPMLPLALFRQRNFSVANLETLLMYGGMALQGFFLVLFLQQVAGFSATGAGAANLVPVITMFLLSRRFGALADRYGPRWFMAGGPMLVAAGFLGMLRLDAGTSYFTDLLPALVVYSLGLAVTVAPLTATVLADADETDAGIASAINNAIARTAGLLATAAVGAVLASSYAVGARRRGRRPAARRRGGGAGRRRARARAGSRPGRRARRRPRGGPARGAGRGRRDVPSLGADRRRDGRPRRSARWPAAAQPPPPDRRRGVRRRPVQRRAGGARAARPGARARPRPGLIRASAIIRVHGTDRRLPIRPRPRSCPCWTRSRASAPTRCATGSRSWTPRSACSPVTGSTTCRWTRSRRRPGSARAPCSAASATGPGSRARCSRSTSARCRSGSSAGRRRSAPAPPPRERLKAMASAVYAQLESHAALIAAGDAGAPGARFRTPPYAFYRLHTTLLIAEADPSLDRELTADMLLGALSAGAFLVWRQEYGFEIPRIQAAFDELVDRLLPT